MESSSKGSRASVGSKKGGVAWSSPYMPDIPLQDRSNPNLEEAYPLRGNDGSMYRVEILPLWHPKRRYFKWIVLFISCMFSVGSYFTYDSIGVVEEDIEEDFDITASQFGLLYSVYSFPNIILPFFGGIGLPIGTTATTFLVFLGGLIVALAPSLGKSFWLLLVGRFIFGMGSETSYVAQNTICCAWFKDGKMLAFAMGLTVSAGRLGSFFTFSTNNAIVEHYGHYYAALWAGAAFAGLSFAAGVIYMFLHYYATWMIKGTKAQLDVPQSQPPINFRELFNYPLAFYVASLVCCIYYAAIFPFQSTAVALLTRTQGLSDDTAGYYVSILPATSFFLSPVFGIIVDRVGKRVYFIIGGMGVLIPAFLLLTETWWPSIISFVLIGLCFALVPAAIWPCLPLLVEEKNIGTAFGLLSGFVNAGLTLTYWIQGEFVSEDGTVEMYMFSALVAVGFILSCVWLVIDVRMGNVCNKVVQISLPPDPQKETNY